MKALTISQPYASLIASGEKWVENRLWGTHHRGPLAIHAGKGTQYLDRDELRRYPTGCVIGTANLLACMPLTSLRSLRPTCPIQRGVLTVGEVLDHAFTEGPWCWILTDISRYREPIPCTGRQGLWDWEEPDLVEVVPEEPRS